MAARGATSHGELDFSDEGGGDLPEVAGHGGTWSTEGLDGSRPKGVADEGEGQVRVRASCWVVLEQSVG
jgi:hypothetical protein